MQPDVALLTRPVRDAVLGAVVSVTVWCSSCTSEGRRSNAGPNGDTTPLGRDRQSTLVSFNQPVAESVPADSLPPQSLPQGFRARVQHNGKWGIIGHDGQWVVEPEYEHLLPGTDLFVIGIHRQKIGTIDTSGTFAPWRDVVAPAGSEALAALRFEQGLAPAYHTNGKLGYINPEGQFRIAPQFEAGWPFQPNGLALVKLHGTLALINTQGQFATNPNGLGVAPGHNSFAEGLEPVLVNGKWGYTNRAGQVIIAPQFRMAGPFRNGRALVTSPEGLAYINRRGQVVSWLEFEDARSFSQGRAAVKVNGQWAFIDTTGRVAILPRYEQVSDFANGYARVRTPEGWGVIDLNGQLRLKATFEELPAVESAELILVQTNGLWGIAALDTGVVVRPQFEEVGKPADGFVAVRKPNGRWGYINRLGRLATPQAYDEALPFQNGVAAVRTGNRWGYIDTAGRWVIPPRYENTLPLSE